MNQTKFDIPDSFRRLAGIKELDLFVVMTVDSILTMSIDEVRFGGKKQTKQLSYSLRNVVDLPCEKEKLDGPVVFNLMGKHCARPDFVLTDEDTLEFVHHMQSHRHESKLLFEALSSNHLLFLGCTLSDWLARFVIRIAKSRTLSHHRPETEFLVSANAHGDKKLVDFLKYFSPRSHIIAMPPAEFVEALDVRYRARNAASLPDVELALPAEGAAPWQNGSMFISYAHEDYNAARRLHECLDKFGVDAWFDRRKLISGDFFDSKIEKAIKSCSYFLPVISTKAIERDEGYFRGEWTSAIERARRVSGDRPFIIPIVIDDTDLSAGGIPDHFQRLHWTRLPNGQATPDFCRYMKELIQSFHRAASG